MTLTPGTGPSTSDDPIYPFILVLLISGVYTGGHFGQQHGHGTTKQNTNTQNRLHSYGYGYNIEMSQGRQSIGGLEPPFPSHQLNQIDSRNYMYNHPEWAQYKPDFFFFSCHSFPLIHQATLGDSSSA